MIPILKQIKKIEVMDASHLSKSNIIKAAYIILPGFVPFKEIDSIGLSSLTVTDKIQGNERIYTSKLTVTLPKRVALPGRKLCFRITTVKGSQYIIGKGSHPYPIVTFTHNYPNSAFSKSTSTMTVSITDIVPPLLLIE